MRETYCPCPCYSLCPIARLSTHSTTLPSTLPQPATPLLPPAPPPPCQLTSRVLPAQVPLQPLLIITHSYSLLPSQHHTATAHPRRRPPLLLLRRHQPLLRLSLQLPALAAANCSARATAATAAVSLRRANTPARAVQDPTNSLARLCEVGN